ncbi:hypothetical protein [methanotrophic endosymbiont of Bathymodiolus puteoserpentis (Logatchev)]|jgi:hypothetical protein|uniref:hypothetical protein n=1 Tax=methanotrophic endosymbiont of Bathymodiolus puteoserpentis (Logatchev) TaxID=343235 RepID=UPI0013C5A61C|nr:hypothetical protein [methanotrophic endosymbiont of Bathymodiolus puteoserpentis (Logatchev)]SHE22811.1 hypothetical protein BPUTEOMOX_3034 [methanotrophic endosymbiont of Bathymodiolus puteoserpentis (Logatchev)]
MINQQRKNQRTIIILALMTAIPFSIAWYLTKDPNFQPMSTNKGELIVPVVTTERSDLLGVDDFSVENIKELAGHWVILNIIPDKECNQVCIDAIHATKQLRLMLNKDLPRVRRAVILVQGIQEKSFQPWWDADDRLLKVKPSPALLKEIKQKVTPELTSGMLILMDPLGNLMMQYKAGFDPYAVKSDLKKLLRISQIG